MLKATQVVKRFGGVTAVGGVSLTLAQGGITGLIGPNGAGKTTFFNCLTGSLPVDEGQIVFDGVRIDGWPSDAVFRRGLARTFQIPRPFPAMSVLDNVMVAATGQLGESFHRNWFSRSAVAAQERALAERARHWIEFMALGQLAHAPARILSGGQRKLLELARIMMAEPRLILLDEPGAGVNPQLLETITARIADLNRNGVTFLIIEHNMELIETLCTEVVVMAEGQILTAGAPRAVVRDPRVIDAYLGAAA